MADSHRVRGGTMDKIEPWGIWHSQALAAGVSAGLAALGRAVVRDYWEHGHNMDEERGDGTFLGADRHHQMMIALAVQKPDLAEAVFNAALANGGPDEDEAQEALDLAERWTSTRAQYATPEWYAEVYALEGCKWDLYTPKDHASLRR